MVDLHCHILPGLDDGVKTVEEARELAFVSAGQGVTAIAATPHVGHRFPTTAVAMENAVAALRGDFQALGIPVTVLHGGEIELSFVWEIPPADLARFSLAQTGRYLLVEFPDRAWPRSLDDAVATVLRYGMRPILAHPERNPDVQDRPDRLLKAVEAGALVQVTLASLEGRLGSAPEQAAKRLIELRLVHLLASDAHGPDRRVGRFDRAADLLGSPELAQYFTHDVPHAIASGSALPPRWDDAG